LKITSSHDANGTTTISAVIARCGLANATTHRTTSRIRNPMGIAGVWSAESRGIRRAIPPSQLITAGDQPRHRTARLRAPVEGRGRGGRDS
jgi:hypothetical protein